jgi:hypothetical protein
MITLEANLLVSISHDNVLRGVQYGQGNLVRQSADKAMKQCGVEGPFAVQKFAKEVMAEGVLYVAMDLAREFDLTAYIQFGGGFQELFSL